MGFGCGVWGLGLACGVWGLGCGVFQGLGYTGLTLHVLHDEGAVLEEGDEEVGWLVSVVRGDRCHVRHYNTHAQVNV